MCLIVGSEHDRDHALGDGWIRWVKRVSRQGLVVVVDFENQRVTFDLE